MLQEGTPDCLEGVPGRQVSRIKLVLFSHLEDNTRESDIQIEFLHEEAI